MDSTSVGSARYGGYAAQLDSAPRWVRAGSRRRRVARRRRRACDPPALPGQPRARGLRGSRGPTLDRPRARRSPRDRSTSCSSTCTSAPNAATRSLRELKERRPPVAAGHGGRSTDSRAEASPTPSSRSRSRSNSRSDCRARLAPLGSSHVDHRDAPRGVRVPPPAVLLRARARKHAPSASARRRRPSRRRSSRASRPLHAPADRGAPRAEEAARARTASGSTACARRARQASSPPRSPAGGRPREPILARASRCDDEEMPLRAAQARLAVLDDYAEREELGALAQRAVRASTTSAQAARGARDLEAEVTGERIRSPQRGGEGISLHELERVLAAAADATTGRTTGCASAGSIGCSARSGTTSRRRASASSVASRRSSRRTRRSARSRSASRRSARSGST